MLWLFSLILFLHSIQIVIGVWVFVNCKVCWILITNISEEFIGIFLMFSCCQEIKIKKIGLIINIKNVSRPTWNYVNIWVVYYVLYLGVSFVSQSYFKYAQGSYVICVYCFSNTTSLNHNFYHNSFIKTLYFSHTFLSVFFFFFS